MNLPLSWQALDWSPGPRSPTPPCLQQPAPRRASWNRQGRVGIHVTSGRALRAPSPPRLAPQVSCSRGSHTGQQTRLPGRTTGLHAVSRPGPSPGPSESRPASAKAVACRLSDSAQPRTPDVPPPRPGVPKAGRWTHQRGHRHGSRPVEILGPPCAALRPAGGPPALSPVGSKPGNGDY